MIGLVEIREVEPDLSEAAIRPQQVGRIRGRAGRGAGRKRRILILRRGMPHSKIHGIDVHLGLSADFTQLVEAVLADIRDVDRRGPRQRHLDAGVPLRGRGNRPPRRARPT